MPRRVSTTVLVGIASVVLAFLSLGVAPGALADDEDEADGADETVHGTLRGPEPDRDPLSDVTITVTQDGEEVGSTTSDEEGSWEVELPGPGRYDVALEPDTLPGGVEPDPESGAELRDVPVPPGDDKGVILQVADEGGDNGDDGDAADPSEETEAGGDEQGFWDSRDVRRVFQLLVEGIKFGAIIAITAVGLSLIFGTTRLINFAHGELVTLGGMTAFFLSSAAAGPGMALIPAAVLAVMIGAGYGWVINRGLWRPLRARGTGLIQMFIITIGLSLFVRHLILLFFGSRPQPYDQYALQQALQLGPITITPRDLVIVIASFVVLVGVGLMLATTRIGKAMRAVADNRDLAESSGIDVSRVVMVVWMMSGALATVGGIFFGLTEILAWDMGFQMLLLMFAAVILGGLGTAYGAMAGGLVIGLVAQMSTLWFSAELREAWALLVLIVVLLVRPQGIFGRAERIG